MFVFVLTHHKGDVTRMPFCSSTCNDAIQFQVKLKHLYLVYRQFHWKIQKFKDKLEKNSYTHAR